jgi:hypothetical protein
MAARRTQRRRSHHQRWVWSAASSMAGLAGLEEPDCPVCATGWHTRCCHLDLDDDGDGEQVERCCDGLVIACRRRPLRTRGGRR